MAGTSMRFRKLRIAWSVGWGLVAVLLIVLWAVSYHGLDNLMVRVDTTGCSFTSCDGRLLFGILGDLHSLGHVKFRSVSGEEADAFRVILHPNENDLGFGTLRTAGPSSYQVIMPHWFCVLMSAELSIAPWIRSRFSLRTLLIAMTLVAVVLGLVVWAASK